MIRYYQQENGNMWMVYHVGGRLFIRTTSGERFGRPGLLVSDYAGRFSAAVDHGKLFYSYYNEQGHTVIRCHEDPSVFCRVGGMEEGTKNTMDEWGELYYFCGRLLFLYVRHEKKGKTLRCYFPISDEQDIPVLEDLEEAASVSVLCAGNELILTVKERYYVMDGGMKPIELRAGKENRMTQMQEIRNEWDRKQKEQETEREEMKKEICRLENLLTEKEKENGRLQNMIQSASRQYNELMQVAQQYRDEAVKWRSKFM